MSEVIQEKTIESKELNISMPVSVSKLPEETTSEAALIRNPVGSDYLAVRYGDHQIVVVLSEVVKAVEQEAKKS